MAELRNMAHNSERSDDIDLRTLWRTAVRSLPRLIVIGLVLGGLTYGALSLIAPHYTSETQLAIESKSTANPFTDPSRASNDSVAVRMDREAVNTHVRALMSTDLGERIVREMNLAALPEFNPLMGAPDAMSALLRRIGIGNPRPGISDQDWALEAYFERLDVYAVRDSRFIGVRFTSNDSELAAAVANRIAETYREHLAHQSLTETDDVQQALAPKISRLAEEAAAAEAEVERFRGEANIFKGGQQATGLNDQQLAELNAELTKIKAARSEAEARANQAREMQKAGNSETLADVQKSPLIQNLVQSRVRVERQISELSATLLPGHPRMRQLSADLNGLKRQIATEVSKIVDGLGKEARVTAAREDAVRKSIDEIKARIVSAGPEEARLRSLEADARSKRAELDRLRAQYEANRVRSDDSRTIPVEAQIVSTARPSSTPVFPKKGASAVLVTVATVLIGLALVVTRGLLSGTVAAPGRKSAGIRRRREGAAHPPRLPDPPAWGPPRTAARPTKPRALPAARTRVKPVPRPAPPPPVAAAEAAPVPAPAAERRPSQPVHPATATIETPGAMAERLESMRQSGLGGARTLLVGSSDSFTLAAEASALGRALSDKGLTVILIDWSLDASGISEALGQPSWPGFSELLEGRVGFEDIVRALTDSDVQLIPSGRSVNQGSGGLDADSINFALDALDDVYDHIVVVARAEPARAVFEAIEGRFDNGVMLVDAAGPAAPSPSGSFLGFDVDGISLFALKMTKEAPQRRPRAALTRVG